MRTAQNKHTAQTRSHRPRSITVFAAAFVAGAVAAVGVNRALDVRLAQSKPRVESEAIFVALRSLPQGSPVTVWDVALRDWPKAMMPASALRASDTFSGHVLKHPLREGQPLLSIQLAPAGQEAQPATEPTVFPPPAAYTKASTTLTTPAENDLWAPAEPVAAQSPPAAVQPAHPVAMPEAIPVAMPEATPVAVQPEPAKEAPPTTSIAAAPIVPPMEEQTVAEIAPEAAAEPTDPTTPPPTETAAVEAVVTDASAPQEETTSAPVTVSEPPAEPTTETASTTTDASPPVTAPSAASDIPEPVIAMPTEIVSPTEIASPTPIDVPPPTPAAPVDRPRPTFARFLVVPESIAVQADASFAARPAAPQQPAASATQTGPQTASRSGANAVRPLPSTATADRGPQSKSQSKSQAGPQGRAPERQGRQGQPSNRGTPATTTPPPRLGSTMFPNLSAGIDAIEGRIRGDQPAQGQAPQAGQQRPLTAR